MTITRWHRARMSPKKIRSLDELPRDGRFVTVEEAARITGYSPTTIRNRFYEKKTRAFSKGGRWYVDVSVIK